MPPGLERQVLGLADFKVAIHIGIEQSRHAATEPAGFVTEAIVVPDLVHRLRRVVGVFLVVDIVVELTAAQHRTEVVVPELQLAKQAQAVVDQRAALEVARAVVVVRVVEVLTGLFGGTHGCGVVDRQRRIQGGVFPQFEGRRSAGRRTDEGNGRCQQAATIDRAPRTARNQVSGEHAPLLLVVCGCRRSMKKTAPLHIVRLVSGVRFMPERCWPPPRAVRSSPPCSTDSMARR
ncbi:hypothetical protein D3C81_919950 [compost metagenome]